MITAWRASVHPGGQTPVGVAAKAIAFSPSVGVSPSHDTIHIGIAQPGDVEGSVIKRISGAVFVQITCF